MVEVRVYYEDTDLGGVVYYANYLRYFERSRTEWLRQHGLSLTEFHRQGIVFAVTRAQVDYLRPATYGDLLEVGTQVIQVRGSRFTLGYTVRRKGEPDVLVKGWTELAAINAQRGRAVRLPNALLQVLRVVSDRSPSPDHIPD